MFCCIDCFLDKEIRAIIDGYSIKGSCDFCGRKNTKVYETGKDDILPELFDGLLDIYTPKNNLPDKFPKDRLDLIKNILCNNWHIFNLKPDCVYKLITTICEKRYKEQPELFDTPVGVIQTMDDQFLEKNAILKNHCWSDFVESIKRKNRFHNDYINVDRLYKFLQCSKKTHKAGSTFYRARMCPNCEGFNENEMKAPPAEIASAGRVNPEGISVLYLSDSVKTTLYEIKAGVFDYVTVGNFKLQKDIDVIDLTQIDKISPFIGVNNGFDFTEYAVNYEHLKMISREIAKPLRRHDSRLDYLPTQYVSDYIKSKGYDGIEYVSTMCSNGINLSVFDEQLFSCLKTTVYDIKSISYNYEEMK